MGAENDIALKLPRFNFQYSKKVGFAVSHEAGIGGSVNIYSASFNTTSSVQDYDLQTIISSSAVNDSSLGYAGKVGGKRITIRRCRSSKIALALIKSITPSS